MGVSAKWPMLRPAWGPAVLNPLQYSFQFDRWSPRWHRRGHGHTGVVRTSILRVKRWSKPGEDDGDETRLSAFGFWQHYFVSFSGHRLNLDKVGHFAWMWGGRGSFFYSFPPSLQQSSLSDGEHHSQNWILSQKWTGSSQDFSTTKKMGG